MVLEKSLTLILTNGQEPCVQKEIDVTIGSSLSAHINLKLKLVRHMVDSGNSEKTDF